MTFDVNKLDFDRCEDEPIHIPESIEAFGYLLALRDSGGIIEIVSENVRELFREGSAILGRNFFDLLEAEPEEIAAMLAGYERARAASTRYPLKMRFRPQLVLEEQETHFDAVIYDSDNRLVIELEPATRFRRTDAAPAVRLYASSVAPRYRCAQSLTELTQGMVDTIRSLTGMDRVVVLKFLEDGSGKVIAEAKAEEVESYLNLYYPATDIPAQARELYTKNWVRLSPDVYLEPSPLIPDTRKSGRRPLDMTQSTLRSFSPIHRQYVRNQGLKASMSFSLVVHEKLWGLISCHHREALYVPQPVRMECENLSQLFGWQLYAKEEEIFYSKREQTDGAINAMLAKLSTACSVADIFRQNETEILRIMGADGFVFYSDPEILTLGTVPDRAAMAEINELASANQVEPLVTSNIADVLPKLNGLHGVRGVLMVPLAAQQDSFTAWFRKPVRQEQAWVGAPGEKSAAASKRDRLTPRGSFEVQVREVSGRSERWDRDDLHLAERFNRMFITYALETQQKLRRNVSDLEQQDRYRNAFLATLAHELRNPLSPIKTGVEILRRHKDEEVRQKMLTVMARQVENMTVMVDDLMEASRVNKGKVKLECKLLDIRDVLEDALATCQALVGEKHHHLQVDVPKEALCVRGDRTRLAQVFSNLINNAAKYTDPGGSITVRARSKADRVSIQVIDNGIGIAPEDIELMFSMFTQMDTHSPRSRGGIGLGLPLAQRLVGLHGGTITARSEGPGKGSQFTVLLPAADAEAQSPSE